MSLETSSVRSSRLLSMILLLQTRGRMTAAEFAERLEVSRRTVLRDVEALSAMGVPVYTERGHGGGIVLLPGSRLDLSRLEPREIEALELAGLDAAQRERLGLGEVHETAARKLATRAVHQPASLSELVIIENSPWLAPPEEGIEPAELVLDLRARTRWEIDYRRSGQERPARLVVDPYGLVSKAGRWYLVADAPGPVRGDPRGEDAGGPVPRLFALERLSAHRPLAEAVRHRPGATLAGTWQQLRTADASEVLVDTRLRSPWRDFARRVLGSRIAEIGDDEDGWCAMTVRFADVRGVRQLLQFAEHLEVLGPPQARALIREAAADLAARHAPLTPG